MGRRATYAIVVDALIGRICVAVDIAVKNYDRGARLIDLADNGGDGVGLVGCGDDDVETVVFEISYIRYLLFIAVVGRTYFDRCLGMKHNLAVNLIVHLRAPVVVAALRDADAIMLFFLA